MFILAEIEPLRNHVTYDVVDGGVPVANDGDNVTTTQPLIERPMLRLCSAQDRRLVGANGQRWWPAISKLPSLGMSLFDGDFTASVDTASASFEIRVDILEHEADDVRRMFWAGAPVKLHAVGTTEAVRVTYGGANLVDGYDNIVIDDLNIVQIFDGRISGFNFIGNKMSMTAEPDMAPFELDVLTLRYLGTGDAEGGEDLKDQLKPWILGRALNVAPVLIDSINYVFQLSSYGPIKAVPAVFERGASFGASIGDFDSYAELVAADIPAGRWGTCLTEGMFRLGAPPYGVITADVDGDYPDETWPRLTGQIIRHVAIKAGVPATRINAASLDYLDAQVPFPINVVITDQMSVLEFAQTLAQPCNAQAGVSWMGKLFVTRTVIGSPVLTLDAQGRRMPPVIESSESDVSPPYKRIQFGAARSWRVHTFDEIAFTAELIDRGKYDAALTYREGNIVSLPDGSRWLYVNPTASSGNYPAEEESPYWNLLAGPVEAEWDLVTGEAKPEDNATVGAPSGTPVGDITADAVSSTINADGGVADNQVDTAAIVDNAVTESNFALLDLFGASIGSDDDNVWRDFAYSGVTLSTTFTRPEGATDTTAVFLVTVVGSRTGGDNDRVSLRMMRGDGTALLPAEHGYLLFEGGGNTAYTVPFFDAAPLDGTNNYTVQCKNVVGHPAWERGIVIPVRLSK